ncbi:MAG: aspartate carbamoyltransferase [Candidatus Latescibacterota bacterium]|nr:MAG: aspartate carbamoyltransferase [Candidatus Latescibacterota bacterium]
MRLSHIIRAQQFNRDILAEVFSVAKEMEEIVKQGGSDLLQRKIMATVFYEPSTRTRLSFESAMRKLGGEVITTENAREFSSAAKGETLEDTVRIVDSYADVIVLRHYESGAAERAAKVSSVPIINAGDGPGQHPTQALLDLYTIEKEIGHLVGLSIAMVGDLANGRTVRSLCYLLAKYNDVKIYFVAPEVVRMKEDIKDYLTEHNVTFIEETDLKKVAPQVDVIYQTRIQKERFGDRIEDYQKAKGQYVIDKILLDIMKKDAIIMHPLPRVDEIAPEVDADPRAAYFRQARNGLYIRMALLKMVLLG